MTLHEEMSMAAHARIAESLRPGSTPVAPARPAPQAVSYTHLRAHET